MVATRLQGILVCVGFAATASSLNLSNKFLIKTFDVYASFSVPVTQLIAIQSFIILLCTQLLHLTTIPLPLLSFSLFKRLFRLGIVYVCHILFGIFAISRLNVPM